MFKMTFTTWENDADHFKSIHLLVENQHDVDFLTALAQKFRSANSTHSGLGNEEQYPALLLEVVQGVLEDHPNVSEKWRNMFIEEDVVYDNLCKYMLESPVDYDYGFCRVMSTVSSSEIEKGSILKVADTLTDVIFVELLPNDVVLCRESRYVMNGDVPDVHRVQWVERKIKLDDLDMKIVGKPTVVSKIVADLK